MLYAYLYLDICLSIKRRDQEVVTLYTNLFTTDTSKSAYPDRSLTSVEIFYSLTPTFINLLLSF